MHIALVTGRGGPPFVERVDAPLVAALEGRDVTVSRPVWHDDVDWAAFDAAIVRTTWDYSGRRDEFVAWASRAGEVTAVWNPPDVLRWNTHKSYLIELEERGAPVVPTAWLGRGDRVELRELMASRDWDRAIVKPAVASGSDGVLRVGLDAHGSDAADTDVGQRHLDGLLAAGDVMVQPFMDAVETRGELSVVVIDGEVSHAVRKVPAAGEFRIQTQFGGLYADEAPDREVVALARWIVEATGHDLLFARVDLLEDASGTFQLAELEVTEPDLYLGLAAEAADRLAAAIVRRVAG